MLTFITNTEQETNTIAQRLSEDVFPGTNIFVNGKMGAGKTVFITSFLKARGVKTGTSSPTYTIAHYHQTNKELLVHYDLYRLKQDDKSSGIDENFFDDHSTVLVEWGERLNILPNPRIDITINKITDTQRKIKINYVGFEIPKEAFNKLIEEYKIPKHVWSHIQAVKKIANETCKLMMDKGAILNKNLIEQAAVLHDLTRYCDFKTFNKKAFNYEVEDATWKFWGEMREKYKGLHHSEVANKILYEKGFFNLGKIVLAHQSMHIFKGFDTLSEKIVHYADGRCKHDHIVSVQERISDLKIRYKEFNSDKKYWDKLLKYNLKLEKELLNYK